MSRPLTQREIKKQQKSSKNEEMTTIYNLTPSIITIQVRDEGSDFYLGERSIQLRGYSKYTDRVSVFNKNQINNLIAKNEIRSSKQL